GGDWQYAAYFARGSQRCAVADDCAISGEGEQMSRFRLTRRQVLGAAAGSAVAGLVLARDTRGLGDAGTPVPGAATLTPSGNAPAPGANVAAKPATAGLDGMLTGDDHAQASATLAPL